MENDSPSLLSLDGFWPYQVVVLADLVSRHTRDVLKQHTSINLSQWRVLAAIGETPGRTSADVVAVTPMDKGIVSRAVATLIETGLAEKMTDPADRRRSSLRLTELGYENYKTVTAALKVALENIPSQTSDGTEFSTVLAAYIKRMSDL